MTVEHDISTNDRIPTRVKLAYGMAEWSTMLPQGLWSFYFLFFLTDAVGIGPAVGSGILFAAMAWDAVSDPVMGIISDRTHTRYGRRRPYLIGIALPLGVFLWLLFTAPPLEGVMLVAYFAVMAILLHTALTVALVSYNALTPEMTRDYDERTSLVSYRVVNSQLTLIVAGAIPLLIVRNFSSPTVGWSAVGAIFGFMGIVPLLITWNATRGWERYSVDTEPLSFKAAFRAIAGNRPFRYIIAMYFFCFAGMWLGGAATIYFLGYWMGFSETQIGIYWVIFPTISFLSVPMVTYIAKRLGKPATFIILVLPWAVAYTIGIMLVQPGQVMFMYLLVAVAGVGNAAALQLYWAMIPDVVEVDEYKTGKRNEGQYYGVTGLVIKVGGASGMLIVGVILQLFGYDPSASPSSTVLLGMRLLYGPIQAGFLIIAILIAFFMPMTRKRHNALREIIEAKKAGEDWDEEPIKALL